MSQVPQAVLYRYVLFKRFLLLQDSLGEHGLFRSAQRFGMAMGLFL